MYPSQRPRSSDHHANGKHSNHPNHSGHHHHRSTDGNDSSRRRHSRSPTRDRERTHSRPHHRTSSPSREHTQEKSRRRDRDADDASAQAEHHHHHAHASRRPRHEHNTATSSSSSASATSAFSQVEALLPATSAATCVLALDAKLIELLYALSPTAADREAKLRVIEDVRTTLRRTGLDIQIYGSLCTGLVIPASDVDCVMMRSSDSAVAAAVSSGLSSALLNIDSAATTGLSQRVARTALSTGIRVAAERMRRHGGFTHVTCIAHAKVPIVKCRHRTENVKVDLSFEKDGCVSSNYLCERFCEAGNELARPLIVLIKALVNHCGLDDPSIGGLGSFPISLLVLWFLKDCVRTRFTQPLQHSLAVLLVGFLKYYGNEFDFRRNGIDYVQGKTFTKAPANDLFIMNPIRPGTNCARAATLYATRVVPQFQKAADALSPLLEADASTTVLEQRLLQFFGRALPDAREWRDVARAAARGSHLSQNMWDQATNLYMGGVL